jgi:hypothetical protein
VDATRVYWTTGSGVWGVAKAGGLIQRVAIAESNTTEIVVVGTRAYWLASQGIRSLDLADPNAIPTTIVSGYGGHLAADATNLYWDEFDNQTLDLIVMTAPLAGGQPVMLARHASYDGNVEGAGVAVDGTAVYWTSASEVLRVGLDGTGFTTLAANNQAINSIAVGPAAVYWSSAQTIAIPNGAEQTTGIREVPK